MDKTKIISVVMPTYNTELSMLKEAVESILNQTFRDFEFIIIDDGSTNGSDEYLNSLQDERIQIIQNPTNIGITKSLNVGLRAANGKYIARMDADDISVATRFEKQYAYMEVHPDIVMCGSYVQRFGLNACLRKTRNMDKNLYRIKTLFYYPGPNHPTMFIRHSTLREYGIVYNENLLYSQDYQLCADLGNAGRVYIIPEVLLRQRVHQSRVTISRYDIQKQYSMITQRKLLEGLLNNVSDEEAKLHYRYSYEKSFGSISDFFKCAAWYTKLIRVNNRVHEYPRLKFALYAWTLLMLITVLSFQQKTAKRLSFLAAHSDKRA